MAEPQIFRIWTVMKRRRPVNSAPRWRDGLNFEGYCRSSFETYNLAIAISRFNIDSFLCKFPLCDSRVREEKCGFSNAEYKYSGFQAINDDAKEFNNSWQDAPSGFYANFDDSPDHFVKWFQLTIEVRRRQFSKISV
ncbi:8750_t:CDS:2 [Ambispora leptoticha]|uniref:8750_t:CDS:1 n=1 Tax=Ambispora leptoticha TaxID=144679 RepID=A0A9N9G737_9GLOM|nr:8750_t:CDS:2 [Ambispora leptoticha]